MGVLSLKSQEKFEIFPSSSLCGIILPERGLMVKNENEFLGILIKCKNQDNCCNVGKIAETAKMDLMDCGPFLMSLEKKGIIEGMDLETFRINPIAFSIYESPQKKAGKSFLKLSVSFFEVHNHLYSWHYQRSCHCLPHT